MTTDMNKSDAQQGQPSAPVTGTERIHIDHDTTKRLGNWTRANRFEVRARTSQVTLDLRSADIPDQVEVQLDTYHTTVKLLVAEDAVIEHWDLRFTGKGRIKDGQGRSEGTHRVRLLGSVTDGEIRIHRGGVAIVSAMMSREYLQDLRQARKDHRYPTIDDPTRPPK
jgi:hypothetical protein